MIKCDERKKERKKERNITRKRKELAKIEREINGEWQKNAVRYPQ